MFDSHDADALGVSDGTADERGTGRRLPPWITRMTGRVWTGHGSGWARETRQALAEDRLVLHAQPIADVRSGEVVRHELLIRMVGRDGELVEPTRFLPAAEEHDLIGEVDRWVTREALAIAARGHPVGLNLSARTVAAPDLVEGLRAELRLSGADASLVVVELAEAALRTDPLAAASVIDRLRGLGCGLALDDVGTSLPGVEDLERLPVDFLKIGVEVVRGLAAGEASLRVVEAVVGVARAFGRRTIAEGVEDEGALRLLDDLGVDLAQGFWIAPPLPAAYVLGSRSR